MLLHRLHAHEAIPLYKWKIYNENPRSLLQLTQLLILSSARALKTTYAY